MYRNSCLVGLNSIYSSRSEASESCLQRSLIRFLFTLISVQTFGAVDGCVPSSQWEISASHLERTYVTSGKWKVFFSH